LGEKLVLVIESKEKDDVILNTVKHLKTLSKFEIPKAVFFIDNFIETSSNKINRQQTLAKLPLS
jgi:O-succinylbenzoic acid--CoA ligase